jgi:hypothetical protein
MAHHQRAVRSAVLLNAGIFGVELIAGWQASSLSLIMDGIHNFSDQLAMVAIWLASSSLEGHREHCCVARTSSIRSALSPSAVYCFGKPSNGSYTRCPSRASFR